jgi:hypothetical protein
MAASVLWKIGRVASSALATLTQLPHFCGERWEKLLKNNVFLSAGRFVVLNGIAFCGDSY